MQAAQRKKKKKKQKVKVGSVISVYWPEDKTWYHGEVISFNDDDASEICEVLYEDGEREVIKLKEEKYKIGNKARDQKLCRLLADGDVNAQLTSIREILYDIEDRLPCKGVSSDRPAWWQAWHVGIDSAVEARSILLLVPFVEKLARILRPNIKTNWWKIQGEQEWFKRLGSVKSSADLYVLVNDLLTKGVDWTEARQFFPICNTQYEVKQGLWDERRQSKRGAKTSQKTKGQLYVKKVSHMNMDNSDKVDQGGIKGQNMKVGMEKAGPDISEPQRKSIQHRRRKMVIRAGKDFGMEEKRSADAAQLLELEKHSSDKENSDKSEQRSSGGSFVDKPNPSARHHREGRSELLSYRTRSKRKADEVKVSEGQKSARTEEGLLSRLRQGLLRVGASRIRSQKEQSNEDESSEASSDEEATPSSSSEGSDENTSADPSEDGEDSCFQRGLKKKTMARKTRAIIGKNGRRSQSPAPSDEEVCSVCKFAGAGEMMLLCDGLKCDEAFHSFCLAIPLQTIPDGDWLCPMCIHQGSMAAGTSKLRKKKLSSESIPPTKKIEAILGMREAPSESVCLTSSKGRNLQYLIKWSSLSHRHDTWVPEDWLLHFDRQRLLSYQRRVTSQYGAEFTDERRPEWLKIDRIIACRKQDTNAGTPSAIKGKATEVSDDDRSPLEYLVKWCNLDYNGSTWEEESSDQDMLDAIQKFSERHLIAKKRELSEQTGRDVAIGILQQPVYIKGGFLHEYQIEGLKWLVANFEEQKSVILADEMGLGKTIQAISFMMCLRHEKLSSKPFLVIAPKSTLPGWEQELQQWGADLNAVVYEGDQTARALIREYEFYTADEAPLFDVLVTSYDLSMRDNSCLQRFEWSCIIVDEGHRVKNMRSKLGSLLKKQTADFRLLLTGTPVQNTLTELFALLHFLDPSEFPDPEQSAQEFAQVDAQGGVVFKDKGGMEQQVSRIHELLQPRMLRRLKREVMRDMIPGKKLVEVRCALTPLQHHLYGVILKKNYKQLNHGNRTGKKRSLNTILMDLKMVCNHPYLFPGKEPDHCGAADEVFNLLVGASGKLQLLQKLLPKLKEEGHRVLLFSQMTRMLDILEDFLSHLGYSFSRIDGSTSAADRQKQISEFNSTQSQDFIFLISTRAGGLGINLPSADTVIIYDPDFNPFVDLQAQARAHRIGQENVVLVYQLITKCSVEEKILERSRQKLAMENLVMNNSDKATVHDLNTLLLHGARKVLKEHDVEAMAVKWTDESIAKLLERDIAGGSDAKEGDDGYLGAIQGPGSIPTKGVLVDASPRTKTSQEWEELLGNTAEQEMKVELGRGKRPRKQVQYTFEPHIDAHEEEEEDEVDNDPSCSAGSSSSSDSDASLDVKEIFPSGKAKSSKEREPMQAVQTSQVSVDIGNSLPQALPQASEYPYEQYLPPGVPWIPPPFPLMPFKIPLTDPCGMLDGVSLPQVDLKLNQSYKTQELCTPSMTSQVPAFKSAAANSSGLLKISHAMSMGYIGTKAVDATNSLVNYGPSTTFLPPSHSLPFMASTGSVSDTKGQASLSSFGQLQEVRRQQDTVRKHAVIPDLNNSHNVQSPNLATVQNHTSVTMVKVEKVTNSAQIHP